MSESLPQSTHTLINRLRRAAVALRDDVPGRFDPRLRAYANTCDQAAGRLTEYLQDFGRSRTEADVDEDSDE